MTVVTVIHVCGIMTADSQSQIWREVEMTSNQFEYNEFRVGYVLDFITVILHKSISG